MDTKKLVQCGFFAALICVCSIIRVPLPFTPIPVTLQTFAVTLAGICLGRKHGVACVTVYLLLGAAGLPVFSGGAAGLGVLLGATGGYLFGFILCVFLIGLVCERFKYGRFSVIAAVFAGALAFYACGAAWYALYANVSLMQSVVFTIVPFIPADALKLLAAVTAAKFLTEGKAVNV